MLLHTIRPVVEAAKLEWKGVVVEVLGQQ